jgi:hypothetical protein
MSARSMKHASHHDIEKMLFTWIVKLSADHGIYVVNGFWFRRNVSVRKASLLEFNNMHSGYDFFRRHVTWLEDCSASDICEISPGLECISQAGIKFDPELTLTPSQELKAILLTLPLSINDKLLEKSPRMVDGRELVQTDV